MVKNMGKYRSGFSEPPWVYSPSAVMDWINASNPPHKIKKFHARKDKKYLEDVEISFDMNVERKKVAPSNFLIGKIREITGYEEIEENFEIIPAAEMMARALSKAKFSNMMTMIMDGEVLYDHPKKGNDIRESIEILVEKAHKTKGCRSIEMMAMKSNPECTADVLINRVHPKKEHSVYVKLDGRIEEELFHRFLNYLKQRMAVEPEDINTSV